MFTIIDLETTGGKPAQDRVVEIAIIVHNGKRIIEHYTSLVNPERKIDPFVVALTGISDEMVANAPLFHELADKIVEMTKGRIFVAHNVRFDYGIIKNEFKRLGQTFTRKQLCTVQLSRKIFPGFPSYSLGKLCTSLEIEIENRHRAYGDAFATTLLLEKLLFNDRKEIISLELKEGLEDSMLPQQFSRKQMEELPEETGVYYFKDKDERILYIGKSKHIKSRIYQHFINDLHAERFLALKQEMAHIRYQLTGSELVAMLLESAEIKRYMPKFNKAQKTRKYRYGIFIDEDEDGFKKLRVKSLSNGEEPFIKCAYRRVAEALLDNLLEKHHLRPQLASLDKMKKSEGKNAFREVLNENLMNMVSTYYFPWRNFFIIDSSVDLNEHSVVWVEDNIYKGFGFFDPEYIQQNIDSLKEVIQPQYDTPDAHRIIRTWLKKNKNVRVITY